MGFFFSPVGIIWLHFVVDALVLMLARQMLLAEAARMVGESWRRVYTICAKFIELAIKQNILVPT